MESGLTKLRLSRISSTILNPNPKSFYTEIKHLIQTQNKERKRKKERHTTHTHSKQRMKRSSRERDDWMDSFPSRNLDIDGVAIESKRDSYITHLK